MHYFGFFVINFLSRSPLKRTTPCTVKDFHIIFPLFFHKTILLTYRPTFFKQETINQSINLWNSSLFTLLTSSVTILGRHNHGMNYKENL